MFVTFNSKFDLESIEIYAGEYFATTQPRIISTVLGSCVSVALRDAITGAAGMNHFMLPGRMGAAKVYAAPNAKYGMFAMELLINEVIKLGGAKRNLVAKVFGGGKVLRALVGAAGSVSQSNVTFALEYLEAEGIPISTSDVGGLTGRRIMFFTEDARVLLKRLSVNEEWRVEKEEESYLAKLRREAKETKPDRVVLF